jgi:hypothetical protein
MREKICTRTIGILVMIWTLRHTYPIFIKLDRSLIYILNRMKMKKERKKLMEELTVKHSVPIMFPFRV